MPFTALVPLDSSPLSQAVLPLVLGMRPGAVVLLHVRDAADEDAEATPPSAWLTELTARVRSALPASQVSAMVQEGRPATAILEAAADLGANLIGLSTHGHTGFNRLVLGSVAEEVIRATAPPVLALRHGGPLSPGPIAPSPLRRVLAAYDGSDRAWRVVETLAMLGAPAEIELVLGGVLEAYYGVADPVSPDPGDSIVTRLLDLEAERIERALARGARRAQNLGFDASWRLARGRIAEEVLVLAEAVDASLIALTTHGRWGPSRWLLGSVAEQVLRASERPLLIAR